MSLEVAIVAGLVAGFIFLLVVAVVLVHHGKGPRPPAAPARPRPLVAVKSSPPVSVAEAAAGKRRTRPERPRALEAERAYLRARRKSGDR